MDLEDCVNALRTTEPVPTTALAAAVTHADSLAPIVFALTEKLCEGIYLVPRDNKLVLYGLNVLAAAKHPGLLDHLLMLARQPLEDLDQVFPHHAPISLQRLLLTVWDRKPAELFNLIEHADMVPEVKWALFDVLARLTFDGRVKRTATTEFLAPTRT